MRMMPFEECAVDLIGPWIIQVNEKPFEFNALTIIDTTSNLVKLDRIDDKTSAKIAKKCPSLVAMIPVARKMCA